MLAWPVVGRRPTANGHEPQAWLTDVPMCLPITLDRDIDTLLPHCWRSIA